MVGAVSLMIVLLFVAAVLIAAGALVVLKLGLWVVS